MESIQYAVFLLGVVFCAYQAITARRILSATLYLACISALISATLYLLGAAQVAVMELSVGAGLVTVLLVYAVSVVGDDALDPASVIPKPLAFVLVGSVAVFLGWMAFPALQLATLGDSTDLTRSLWQNRVLDVWIQIVLIFSGVMGVLGLLSEQAPGKKEEHQ
ncbi:MAG TPA: hydrogenase subunit MbhD domain-containing protein [Anaerolineales bacterium]|nr:hydrogenase subunit MbhD domain-containing protein [Anaerolineales bacterium]